MRFSILAAPVLLASGVLSGEVGRSGNVFIQYPKQLRAKDAMYLYTRKCYSIKMGGELPAGTNAVIFPSPIARTLSVFCGTRGVVDQWNKQTIDALNDEVLKQHKGQRLTPDMLWNFRGYQDDLKHPSKDPITLHKRL